jgi:hypothetical protein
MPAGTIRKLVFPAACTVCLAAGFASAGRWMFLPLVVLALSVWVSACRWRSAFLPHLGLALSVGLAADGLWLSVPLAWMMFGAVCALAGWDVILFQWSTAGIPPGDPVRLLELRHFRSLLLALGVGLAVSVAGPLIRFRISFWWMMLIAALALAGLEGLRRGLLRGGSGGADRGG